MKLFVDTNFFLQCKGYKSILWEHIGDDTEFIIYIARPVQVEIDKLKNDGNSRRAKKAREVNSLFREMLANAKFEKEVIIGNIKITFRFAPNYQNRELHEVCPSLDLSRPDNELIAITKKFCSLQEEAFLLTQDTNPKLTANVENVRYLNIPDSWSLDPETDERDKKISELENKLTWFQDKEPKLKISFFIDNVKCSYSPIDINIIDHEVNEENIDIILRKIKTKFPLQKVTFDQSEQKENEVLPLAYRSIISNVFIPPTEEEIRQYEEIQYPKWLTEIRGYIEKTLQCRSRKDYIKRFRLEIENVGNISIENVILKISAISGLVIKPANYSETYKQPSVPVPPEPPKGRYRSAFSSIFDSLGEMASMGNAFGNSSTGGRVSPVYIPPAHDRYGFYWKDGKPSTDQKQWVFTCDEYRHKSGKEVFDYYLGVERNSKEVIVKIEISGKNMIDPIAEIFKGKCILVEGNDEDISDKLIENITNRIDSKEKI